MPPSPPDPPTKGIKYRFPVNTPALPHTLVVVFAHGTPPEPPPGPSPVVAGTEVGAFPPAPPAYPPGPGMATCRRRVMSLVYDPFAPETSIVPLMTTSPDASQYTGLLTLS